jgi:hypothetical protein
MRLWAANSRRTSFFTSLILSFNLLMDTFDAASTGKTSLSPCTKHQSSRKLDILVEDVVRGVSWKGFVACGRVCERSEQASAKSFHVTEKSPLNKPISRLQGSISQLSCRPDGYEHAHTFTGNKRSLSFELHLLRSTWVTRYAC